MHTLYCACIVSRSTMSATVHDSDDDTPQLSAHALQALQEFYAEHAARDQDDATANEMPTEDWVRPHWRR